MSRRPLSPHLQIYRLPLTAWVSITHRVTGVVLSAGFLAAALLMLAIADGPAAFTAVRSALASVPGRILLIVWLFSLFLHACHGVRHLLWDAGIGFRRETLNLHAIGECLIALLLTAALVLTLWT